MPSKVSPSQDQEFIDSECVSCGACVQACPTSTLMEKSVIERGQPERSVITTTCAYCGVGCSFKAELRGEEVVRMVPYKGLKEQSTGRRSTSRKLYDTCKARMHEKKNRSEKLHQHIACATWNAVQCFALSSVSKAASSRLFSLTSKLPSLRPSAASLPSDTTSSTSPSLLYSLRDVDHY